MSSYRNEDRASALLSDHYVLYGNIVQIEYRKKLRLSSVPSYLDHRNPKAFDIHGSRRDPCLRSKRLRKIFQPASRNSLSISILPVRISVKSCLSSLEPYSRHRETRKLPAECEELLSYLALTWSRTYRICWYSGRKDYS